MLNDHPLVLRARRDETIFDSALIVLAGVILIAWGLLYGPREAVASVVRDVVARGASLLLVVAICSCGPSIAQQVNVATATASLTYEALAARSARAEALCDAGPPALAQTCVATAQSRYNPALAAYDAYLSTFNAYKWAAREGRGGEAEEREMEKAREKFLGAAARAQRDPQ